MSEPVVVFASFVPQNAKVDEVRAVLQTMRVATHAEAGCEVYDLYSAGGGDNPTTFHLFERYADADALQAHRGSDHYKAYRAAIADLLDSQIGVVVLTEEP